MNASNPAASGFFVLRSPTLPFTDFLKWSDGTTAASHTSDAEALREALATDRVLLRQRLDRVVSRPEFRDALFVASPAMEAAVDEWRKDPDTDAGRRAERGLVSYFTRAATRPTPFGLFAGLTTGSIGTASRLELDGLAEYRRYSRFDIDYLSALTDALGRDARLRRDLVYRPNSSLYELGDRLHFAAARQSDSGRSYRLVAADKTPYLLATIERARDGERLVALAAALVDEDVSQSDAEEYIDALIDNQILVAELRPQVTGPGPTDVLIETLNASGATREFGGRLDAARTSLADLDAGGLGAAPERYRQIASLLEGLPVRPDVAQLVNVDLVKPARDLELSRHVVADLTRGIGVLHAFAPVAEAEALRRFREEFAARYETREVRIVEALDEEHGIGFERSTTESAAAPLLAGLAFEQRHDESVRWSQREALLFDKLTNALANGSVEITIDNDDVVALGRTSELPLPGAFEVVASIAAVDEAALARGAFRVFVQSVSGPSGARVLGRFCHADALLEQHVRRHLRAEEATRPDCVFAEIVHLPEGSVGNILLRPVLREYEIPYLGRSGAPQDRQLPVDDLLVSVQDERIVLRSRRLETEVIPRLTTAHNYAWRSLGVYRFLCALQHQGVVPGIMWQWGPLEGAAFLPRVVTGRTVLSRARWTLQRSDLEPFRKPRGAAQFAAVQALRAARQLPRYLALADSDNELVVDFDNVMSIEALAHQLKNRDRATLVELFPGPDELCVSGPEGRFTHQIVVPFVQSRVGATSPARPAANSVGRRFAPGSEWLYVKLFSGPASADHVLDRIAPVLESALATGAADRWFFIRYADPEPHLRVRLHGTPDRLLGELLPALRAVTEKLLDGARIWRVQLDTYEREVERYGGDRGVDLAERIFFADSAVALGIIRHYRGDAAADLRWRLALLGIHRLFDDFALPLEQRRSITRRARDGYGRELGAGAAVQRELSRRFRSERPTLERLIDDQQESPSELLPGSVALRQRSDVVAPLAAEVRRLAAIGELTADLDTVVMSYAHMHVNRILRAAQRAQELVLYEFLDRLYSSQAARRA